MVTEGEYGGHGVGTMFPGPFVRRHLRAGAAIPAKNILMKNNNLFRLLFTAIALGAFASSSYAGPGPQYWDTQRKEAQFKQLKSGDKIAYVCNECKTVSEVAIDSPAAAMALCKEHATVTCPACKKTSKIVRKEKRNDAPTHSEVIYVNDKGVECAFFAKVVDKK